MAHPLRRACLASVVCVALAATACSDAFAPESGSRSEQDVPVRVLQVGLDASDTHVVILAERGGERFLPILIGRAEATSIALRMGEHELPRPNSHDLTRTLIQSLDGSVERVVVTELRDNTYYAVMDIQREGMRVAVDARPSDAIAIALRAGAPIFVRDELLTLARSPEEPSERRPEREI